jgi:uncharacterized protein (DUF924 family)
MTTNNHKKVDSIIQYWFGNEEKSVQWRIWFPRKEDQPVVDKEITEKFENDLKDAINGKLESEEWKTPRGILAKVIILDQFSRVIYRGTGRAFTQDEKALALAREAIAGGVDRPPHITNCHRTFLYMPFMHSESLQAQEEGIELQKQILSDLQNLNDQQSIDVRNYVEGSLKYSEQHRDMIKQFGRFPYRNKLLNRPNTPEEEKYLNSDHISFL